MPPPPLPIPSYSPPPSSSEAASPGLWFLRSVPPALIILLAVHLCLAGARLGSGSSCPSVCSCKWKGGKRSVECPERALISIPQNVDPDTQVLDMSGNNLQILPREAFVRAGLLNLQKAYLKDCRLGQIDHLAFHGLTNLVELDLSGNLLTFVPSQSFLGVSSLREMSLARNPIQKIEPMAFHTVPSLEKLDLEGCEIRTVAPSAFEGLQCLESLRLDGNKLEDLGARTVDSLRRLKGVHLHDNPWLCDCRLRAVRDWMEDANVARPVEPLCDSPLRLATRPIASLETSDLACKPEMLVPPRWRVVEAREGGNVSLFCRAAGVPPPSVFWAWGGRPVLDGATLGPPGPSSRAIVREEASGPEERTSILYLPDSKRGDEAEFTCVAENEAGSAEVNFSLRVTRGATGAGGALGSGQSAGLAAALSVLLLVATVAAFLLLARFKRDSESKTAPGCEGGTSGASDGQKREGSEGSSGDRSESKRSTDIPYTTSHYEGNGSVIGAQRCARGSSAIAASGSDRNPDIVPEGEEKTVDSFEGRGAWGTAAEGGYRIRRALAADPASRLPFESTSDKTPIIDGEGGAAYEEGVTSRAEPPAPRYDQGGYPPDYGLPIAQQSLPPRIPTDAKTLRVWQRGVLPVLPPIAALRRVVGDSTDEGEGCGTDV